MPVSSPVPLQAGADFTVVGTLHSKIKGGGVVSYDGLLDDQTAYGSVWQDINGRAKAGPILTDLRSGEVTYLDQAESGDSIGNLVVGQGWVVWLELNAHWDDLASWKLYSYETATHTVRQLAESSEDQHGWNIHQLRPSIDDGTVYLSAVQEVLAPGESVGAAYSVPIDGSGPLKLLVRGSIFTQASDGYLFFDQDGHLQKRDLSTGRTTTVAKSCRTDYDECEWGVGGGALVWNPGMDGTGVEAEPDMIHMLEPDGSQVVIDAAQSNSFQVSEKWVTFVDDSNKEFVYRISDRKMALLPDGWRMSAISGDTAVWIRGDGERQTYRFVRLR